MKGSQHERLACVTTPYYWPKLKGVFKSSLIKRLEDATQSINIANSLWRE
jgi:hypothetical protein